MANEIKFVLTVDDKGQIKSVTKNLKDLGAETARTTTAQTKASNAAHNHFDQQSKGIIGTANSTRSFSKLTQTIGSGSNGLVGAYATLAANVFAVSAAFMVLRDAAQVEQVARGLELMGNRLGITLKIASDNVKEISGGLLTTEQAMRSTAQVIASGFKTEQLERITGVAKNASFALGRDMTESMDRLTRGAIKLEPELLDELGIMVRLDEASAMYARSIGKSVSELTVAEKRQGFMNAVLAEGEAKFGGLSDAAGNLTGLTKLQATFKDLTKDILNVVNIAVIPLANLFSASPGALLGAMVLFAGTLKNQLIPGFKDMASQAEKAAIKTKEMAQAEITASAASNLRGKAVERLKGLIADNTVTQADYVETTTRLNNTLIDQETRVAAARAANQTRYASLMQSQANMTKERISAVQSLHSVEMISAANVTKSQSVQLVANGKLKDALSAVSQATSQYNQGLVLQSKAAGRGGTALIGLRAGLFGAAAGARVLGVALVNAIPIIGQIIFVASLLIDAVKAMYEAFVGKEVIEARKNLNAIMDSIVDKEKEYRKIQEGGASAASKQAASFTLISNSINEQINALEELSKAEESRRKKRDKEIGDLADKPTSSYGGEVQIPVYKRKFKDKEFGEFVTAGMESDIPLIKEHTKTIIDSFNGIDKVMKLKGKGVEDFYKAYAPLRSLGEMAVAIGESFKELENATKDFIKSATPTTPYDGLVSALGKSRKAVIDLNTELSKTSTDSVAMAKILGGIGEATERFITPGSIEVLEEFRAKGLELIAMEKELNDIKGFDAKSRSDRDKKQGTINTLKAEEVEIGSRLISSITKELILQEEKFLKIQNQHIMMSGQIALAQAQVSVLGRYNDLTGEGIKAKLAGENKVRNLQAAQLLLQASLLRESIRYNNTQLDGLKIKMASLKLDTELAASASLLIQIGNQAYIVAKRNEEAAKGDKKDEQRIARLNEELKKTEEAIALRTKQIALQQENARAEAGAAALEQSAAAQTMQNVSKAYILAEGAARSDKTALETAKSALSVAESKNAAENDSVKIARILNGLEETSLDKLISSRSAIKDLFDLKTAVNNADKKAQLSELNAARELAKISAPDTADSEAAYKLKEKQIQDEFNANTKKIEAQKTLSILEAAGVKSNVEIAEISKANLDIRKELLDVQSSIVEKQLEGLALDKKIAAAKQGRDLTPIEEWNLTRKAALLKLQTATAEYDLKMSIIKAEYRLLEAKTKIDRLNAIGQIEALAGENKEGTPLFNAYANLIKEFDKLLGYQGTTLQAIIDNGVAKLKTASLDIAAAAVDAAMRKPSTSTVGSALGNSTDVEEVRIDGIKSAKPATGPVVDEQVGQSIFSETAIKKGEELRQVLENIRKEAELASILPDTQFETLASRLQKSLASGIEMFKVADELQSEAARRTAIATVNYVLAVKIGNADMQKAALDELQKAKTDEIALKFEAMSIRIQGAHFATQPWIDSLKELGPDGNAVATFMEGSFIILEGINRIGQGFEIIKAAGTFEGVMAGLSGVLQGVSGIITQISAIYKASSDAKIANIDKEIAAEQKRDGKSAASLAKIAAMEKKKEAMAKKQFEVNKKLQLANAVVSTAAAIANALATVPFFPMGMIMAAIAGVAGAAQIAAISSTSFQSASASTAQNTTPSKLSIGSRSSTVDLAKDNKNAGGEVGYLTGSQGQGTNASDFRRAAYGAKTFGNAGYIVGEKGPEMFVPDVPGTINTNDEIGKAGNTTAAFHINTIDATGVEDLLMNQRGNIIGMLREAANANGQPFMEKVNTNMYRPRARKV